jgi:hypothetical protein
LLGDLATVLLISLITIDPLREVLWDGTETLTCLSIEKIGEKKINNDLKKKLIGIFIFSYI